MTGVPELIEVIRAEIGADGPMTFARFMELALYHPEHGYYASGRANIGRGGDFFTNVSVGATFGRLLAAQFAEMWEKLDCPADFTIVEQGANDGVFARDVLEYARGRLPEFFQKLRYAIVEPHPRLQEMQQRSLSVYASKISWTSSIDTVDPFTGVHFSNELFDALPVRLLVSDGTEWLERCVAIAGELFAYCDGAISDRALEMAMKAYPIAPAGFTTEVALDSVTSIQAISARLTRGYVVVMDYGLSRSDRLAAHRSSGTLQMRATHQQLDSPFAHIGEADITAHIDWTTLANAAQRSGLEVAGFCDQHHFLTGIVSGLCGDDLTNAGAKSRRALQTLLHPEMLGRSFQALVLRRNAPDKVSGLRFAQRRSLFS